MLTKWEKSRDKWHLKPAAQPYWTRSTSCEEKRKASTFTALSSVVPQQYSSTSKSVDCLDTFHEQKSLVLLIILYRKCAAPTPFSPSWLFSSHLLRVSADVRMRCFAEPFTLRSLYEILY